MERYRPRGALSNPSETPRQRYGSFTTGITQIVFPSNMMPVVCLTSSAFPIVATCLDLDDGEPPGEIQLPVIAGSVHGRGRIFVCAQATFFSSSSLQVSDTAKFLSTCLKWICGPVDNLPNVALYGFSREVASMICSTLRELEVECAESESPLFSEFHAIFVPTDLHLDQDLIETFLAFLGNGGGLAVLYFHNQSSGSKFVPINQLLKLFGLSFPLYILNKDKNHAGVLEISTYEKVCDVHFIQLCQRFKDLLVIQECDPFLLDELITVLRYYITVCDHDNARSICDLLKSCKAFLNRTDYILNNQFCPDVRHKIIGVLLQDIYRLLPISKENVMSEHLIFPGKTGDNVELTEFEMTLPVGDTLWLSTGLWLPAGVQGTVECHGTFTDIVVQIGAHSDPLPEQTGPWNRWPYVLSLYPMSHAAETVGTPFGGIVYITPIVLEYQPLREVAFAFKNFCRYPRYVYDHPEIWSETRDIDVPWGEIDIGDIIFVLPSVDIRKVMDFENLKDTYDHFTRKISAFLSYELTRPHRIVFDVEDIPESEDEFGAKIDYPATFRVDDIQNIVLEVGEPTLPLFNMLRVLAMLSLREDCFDETTESALAALAAAVTFEEHFPGFDPFLSGFPLPPLFRQFWEIETLSSGVFSKTMVLFQGPEYVPMDAPDDMWVEFVRELCRCGRCNFTKLLEQSKAIPLNISMSLQGLPIPSHEGQKWG